MLAAVNVFGVKAASKPVLPPMKSLFLLPNLLLLVAPMQAQVLIEALPEPGIQPQIAVNSTGVVHLVYLKGDPKGCDIRHSTRRLEGGPWSAPVTVNSERRSAIATGTIRGAQIALGNAGSVQVIWNGSADTKPGKIPQSPLLYSRLQPGAEEFSPQQNLLGDTTALDGGASVAANVKGHVGIFWHASPAGEMGEGSRLVWARYSTDDGRTFSAPAPLNSAQPGVCACCSLRAHLAADDTLSVLYRAATTPNARGMTLITQKAGRTALTKLDDWSINACPMSSASFLPGSKSLRAAWENDGQIVTALMDTPESTIKKIGLKNAKHPALAQNTRGQTLVTSIIGSGWSKAGSLHWVILDSQGLETESGGGVKLPVWSYAAAYARPDGTFVILK